MTSHEPDQAPIEEPLAQLERELMTEFVSASGHSLHDLLHREDEEARRLLTEASRYAAGKLAEVETRSRYVRRLHGEP